MILALCLFGLCFTIGYGQQTLPGKPHKVGYINMETFVSGMPEIKDVSARVTFVGDSLNDILKLKRDTISILTRRQEFSDDYILRLQDSLKAQTDRYQNYILGVYTKEVKKLQDKVKTAVIQVARDKGYTQILDSSQRDVLYAEPGQYDITLLVKQKLGME